MGGQAIVSAHYRPGHYRMGDVAEKRKQHRPSYVSVLVEGRDSETFKDSLLSKKERPLLLSVFSDLLSCSVAFGMRFLAELIISSSEKVFSIF